MTKAILLAEDSRYQRKALAAELEERGWQVIHAQDVEDAIFRIEQSKTIPPKIDMAAVDLGLPPGVDNPQIGGIKLAKRIRARLGEKFPILAYTSLTPKTFDYSLALKELLAIRVSFIYLRPMDEKVTFADIVESAWLGYMVVAPEPADFLSRAISNRPDPLDDKHWETLSLLDQQLGYAQIADKMSLSVDGIKARVARIKDILVESGEVPDDAQLEDLVHWYHQNKVRYTR